MYEDFEFNVLKHVPILVRSANMQHLSRSTNK
jgi:hypothetical protein